MKAELQTLPLKRWIQRGRINRGQYLVVSTLLDHCLIGNSETRLRRVLNVNWKTNSRRINSGESSSSQLCAKKRSRRFLITLLIPVCWFDVGWLATGVISEPLEVKCGHLSFLGACCLSNYWGFSSDRTMELRPANPDVHFCTTGWSGSGYNYKLWTVSLYVCYLKWTGANPVHDLIAFLW